MTSDALSNAIQGWFTWKWLYDWVAKSLAPATSNHELIIVEVGVWKGASITHLCHALSKYQKHPFRVLAVDTWSMDTAYGVENELLNQYIVKLKADGQTLYDVYDRSLRDLGLRSMVTDYRMSSLEAAKLIPRADFVFIDADHSADAVEQDARAWSPVARVLAGHDVGQPGVCRGLVNAFGVGGFYPLPLLNCWTTDEPLAKLWLERLKSQCADLVARLRNAQIGDVEYGS